MSAQPAAPRVSPAASRVPLRSHLLEGTVRHRRSRPIVYELQHDVWYLALDLDELDEVDRRSRLLSRNRRNVLQFRDDDHWPSPARELRATVHEHLRAEGVDPAGWQITLVTAPRVVGYVFNPASFYLCRDGAGTVQMVIVEVHNTHHERHLYTLRPGAEGTRFVASMEKEFYVSPFIDMEGHYTVQVIDEPHRLRISITEGRDGVSTLAATLLLRRRPLTDRGLARMLIRYPFVTHKTIGMIHLHALRLWRRGIRFQRHGEVAG